jgi:hypothetical protein
MSETIVTLATLLLALDDAQPQAKVGEEHEITRSYETSSQGSDGSTSSSSGHTAILERVVRVNESGLELEYDLPKEATAEDRARDWHFPARVFRSADGSMELLNRAELEGRLGTWLKAAGWTPDICGRWIFTWNAFRIECDPQSVIKTIQRYDLRSANLREGAVLRDHSAKQAGTLRRTAVTANGSTFEALLELEPGAVRQASAESDVAVGEILRKPVTLEAALQQRARERVSGTILIRFDADPAGNAWRRTKVTKIEKKKPDGVVEVSTATEVVTRELASTSER